MANVANTIGEAWVLIQGDTRGLQNKLRQAQGMTRSAASDMESRWLKVGNAMRNFGLGATLGVTLPLIGVFVKGTNQAREYEKELHRLSARLRQTGEYTEPVIERFKAFADELQKVTIYSDEQTLAAMRMGAHLGISAAKLEEFTKAAIGLAERVPMRGGGEMSLGMAAKFLSMAAGGNYTMLQRYIPGLDKAASAQQKWALVMEYTAEGFVLATKRVDSFDGALKVLRNQFDDASKGLAIGLLPNMTAFVKTLTDVLIQYNELNPQQKSFYNYLLLTAALIGPGSLLIIGLASLVNALEVLRLKYLRVAAAKLLAFPELAVAVGAGYLGWKVAERVWKGSAAQQRAAAGITPLTKDQDVQYQQLRTQMKIDRKLGNGVPVAVH